MNVEHSVEYLMRIKEFRHGAANYPRDPVHADDPDYNHGFLDGQRAWKAYLEETRRFLADTVSANRQ